MLQVDRIHGSESGILPLEKAEEDFRARRVDERAQPFADGLHARAHVLLAPGSGPPRRRKRGVQNIGRSRARKIRGGGRGRGISGFELVDALQEVAVVVLLVLLYLLLLLACGGGRRHPCFFGTILTSCSATHLPPRDPRLTLHAWCLVHGVYVDYLLQCLAQAWTARYCTV